jgi:DNA-binding CsgD family transcriptional regulator
MRKSGRVRFRDVRSAYRLVHDCCDVGHDPKAWPALLVAGVAQLVDAQIGIAAEIGFAGSPPVSTSYADMGWSSPKDRDFWANHCLIEQNFREESSFQKFAAFRGRLITRSREQLVADEDWYKSAEFNRNHRTVGMDDRLASSAKVDHSSTLFTLILLRPVNRERFGARERRVVRMFHHEVAGHLGKSLVREAGGFFHDLPPRLRRALRYLLEGDSQKQMACRMGLSRHTVHEYVTKLYGHFGIGSRGELMAFCHRHGVGPNDLL